MNLGNLNSVSKSLHYGSQLRPGRDWLVLLGVFAVGLAVTIVYSLITFSQVTKGQAVGNAVVSVPAQIKLDQVKALFDSRAAERQRYGTDYRFVDPSL